MMKLIIPNSIKEFISEPFPETDAADGTVWNASTTYAKDAKVRHEHISYTSLDNGNVGNNPAKTYSGDEAKWKKLEATGPYKMLDEFVETQTKGPKGGKLSFCVPYDRADAFALLNLAGFSAHITIYDLDETAENQIIFDEELNLMRDIFHLSLYEYNYSPLSAVTRIVRTDLPLVINGKLCVELDAGDEEIEPAIGHIIVGRQHELGWTEYGAEVGFTDYSKKQIDDFGVTRFVRRSSANRTSLPIYLHPDSMDYVYEILNSVRSMPCLWVGDNDDFGKQCLTVYGWMEDFREVYTGPNETDLSLEIQGLI